jgi:hypothetical protein
VLDIMMRNGEVHVLILPGGCLHYGRTRGIDKTMLLLHHITLSCGVHAPLLTWVLEKVRSVTTDMGTELSIVDAPNVMPAFLRRAHGVDFDIVLRLGVDPRSRLFPKALRRAGWSHMFGNLMNTAALSVPQWPRIIDACRTLCRFFRNLDWRKEVNRKVGSRFPSVALLLKGFSCSFAKWRY